MVVKQVLWRLRSNVGDDVGAFALHAVPLSACAWVVALAAVFCRGGEGATVQALPRGTLGVRERRRQALPAHALMISLFHLERLRRREPDSNAGCRCH